MSAIRLGLKLEDLKLFSLQSFFDLANYDIETKEIAKKKSKSNFATKDQATKFSKVF